MEWTKREFTSFLDTALAFPNLALYWAVYQQSLFFAVRDFNDIYKVLEFLLCLLVNFPASPLKLSWPRTQDHRRLFSQNHWAVFIFGWLAPEKQAQSQSCWPRRGEGACPEAERWGSLLHQQCGPWWVGFSESQTLICKTTKAGSFYLYFSPCASSGALASKGKAFWKLGPVLASLAESTRDPAWTAVCMGSWMLSPLKCPSKPWFQINLSFLHKRFHKSFLPLNEH